MDLLEDLRMSFLKLNFVTIHIIHQFLHCLNKNHLNYLKYISDAFLKSILDRPWIKPL